MKKLIAILFLLGFTVSAQQKYIDRNFQITRVSLKEKFNLPARMLPRLLIQAYCEGKIAGYYPYKPETVCSYHEFAAHFNVLQTQPSVKGDAYENVDCPSGFCITKDDPNLDPFCLYFDIIEDKLFNTQTSTQKHKIKYIRLTYCYKKHDLEIISPGPVFLYDDVIQLSAPDYALMNPKNTAAKIGFKQYFEGRMFHGFFLDIDGKPRPTNPDRERDKWEH